MSEQTSALSEMTAVILAGGLGTRLRSILPDQQKVLANVGEKPFISFLLNQLAQSGVRRVVFCTGYRARQVSDAFGTSYGGIALHYSEEPSPMGTGGALRLVLPLITSPSALVMNGDSICEVDLLRFAAWHAAQGSHGSLVLSYVPDSGRYGSVQLGQDEKIVAFTEKDQAQKPGWINAGIYLLDTHWIGEISPDEPVSLERALFPEWVKRGLMGFRADGRFLDIGTPESYALAGQFFGAARDLSPS